MNNIQRFAAYAAAFEKAYIDDDWSEVAGYFARNAVYEIGLPLLGMERAEGRDAIIVWFKDVLDRFDRHFTSRELTLLDGPREDGDTVWIGSYATYAADGVPSFELHIDESIRFEDGLIVHLEDHYKPEMVEGTLAYVLRHAETLGIDVSAAR